MRDGGELNACLASIGEKELDDGCESGSLSAPGGFFSPLFRGGLEKPPRAGPSEAMGLEVGVTIAVPSGRVFPAPEHS